MSGLLEVRHLFPGVAKLIIRKSVQNFHEFQSLLKISAAVWPKKSSRLFSRSDGKFNFQNHAVHLLVGQGFREHCCASLRVKKQNGIEMVSLQTRTHEFYRSFFHAVNGGSDSPKRKSCELRVLVGFGRLLQFLCERLDVLFELCDVLRRDVHL